MEWVKADATRARPARLGGILAAVPLRSRGLLDSVRRRLILVMVLALAPIAGLNIVQGFLQWRTAEEEARQRLLQNAVASASTVGSVFASVENVLQALRTVADVSNAAPGCASILHGASLSLPFSANIGVIDADGQVLCSALPAPDREVTQYEWWRAVSRQKQFMLSGKHVSRAANADVLVGLLPEEQNGRFAGALAMGIDLRWLENLVKRETPAASGIVAVFSPQGEELVSNSRTMSAALFGGLERPSGAGRLKEAVDASGRRWTYATAGLDQNGLIVAFALPSDVLFGWRALALAASIAIPAIVAAFSLVALWLAVDRIVLRWLTYFRRVTAVYARGHYRYRPTRLDDAPMEFRVLGESVENMALAVRQRDARLRENLAEKTALVREIHHRIKNSLQVVVSLLSLYGAGVRRPEDRQRFDQLRMRVNTLALVHRILYEASDGSQVRLRELLRELGALIESGSERNLKITVDAQDAPLFTDMAVPLALMVVEIALNFGALRDEAARASAVPVRLSGEMTAQRLAITVCARLPAGAEERTLNLDLAAGFAAQLGGELTRARGDGNVCVSGIFPCRPAALRPVPRSDAQAAKA